ncbi:hypothetical protein [Longibacter sp.]|uniref:hypothetical protein n=1 Tax=Longibacter sp. TaxID=2045415 RepID=UPI003EB99B89
MSRSRAFSSPAARTLALALCVSLLFAFTACDSGGSGDDGSTVEPSYTLDATGDSVDASFSGSARWSSGSTDASAEAMAVSFSSDDRTDQGLLIRGAARPSTGTYSVQSIDGTSDNLTATSDFSFYYVDGQSDTSVQYLSTGGTITITASSDDRLSGTFDVTVKRVDPLAPGDGETSATITGTFDAPYVDSGVGVFAP